MRYCPMTELQAAQVLAAVAGLIGFVAGLVTARRYLEARIDRIDREWAELAVWRNDYTNEYRHRRQG